MKPIRVMDTSALLVYAEQRSPEIGYQLVMCKETGQQMIASAACVAEAYQAASDDGLHILDVLVGLDAVTVESVQPGDARVTGLIAKRVGRLGLAHACMLALGASVPVLTTDSDAAGRVLGDQLIHRLN